MHPGYGHNDAIAMEMFNMTDIDRLLQSIGKRSFLNCYETAGRRGEEFGIADMLRCDPALRGLSPKAHSTRASGIRRLFREGRAEQAVARCQIRRRN